MCTVFLHRSGSMRFLLVPFRPIIRRPLSRLVLQCRSFALRSGYFFTALPSLFLPIFSITSVLSLFIPVRHYRTPMTLFALLIFAFAPLSSDITPLHMNGNYTDRTPETGCGVNAGD